MTKRQLKFQELLQQAIAKLIEEEKLQPLKSMPIYKTIKK